MNGCSFKGFLAQGRKFCQAFFGVLWGSNIEKTAFSLILSVSCPSGEEKRA
jgi:hypothetical protein